MTDAIRVTRLNSGLTVVTERMERVETVSFGAYVNTGTRHEVLEENGVSHFLEHMAFKGTARRSAAAIAEEIENVGGHINAYTAREQTAYYVKLLKEDLELGADIIGDILTHSVFAPDEIERERGVILQEIGQANDTPDDIIFDHFQETAYPAQAMGRPVLGTEPRIRAMTRDMLTGYMGKHYSAENEPELFNRKLIGYIDCNDKDYNNIYEFKCVQALENKHYIQLAIYAYLHIKTNENKIDTIHDFISEYDFLLLNVTNSQKKHKSKSKSKINVPIIPNKDINNYNYFLYNIFTDELVKINTNIETLTNIINILVENKLFPKKEINDNDFINEMNIIKSKYDISSA